MSLQETPAAQRFAIGFFGLRNAGKSSLINALTGQKVSVVSPVKGTTTDPVKKAMELFPLGPVLLIDTPGVDDEGDLGTLRVERAMEVLSAVHAAVLVVDAAAGEQEADRQLEARIRQKNVPLIKVFSQTDRPHAPLPEGAFAVSAKNGTGMEELKRALGALKDAAPSQRRLLEGLVKPSDTVLLVIPIDESAPKGRLILPQQTTIRELLDTRATVLACREGEVRDTLGKLKALPDLVICDSQVFASVAAELPQQVPLTSFSILFARYKGDLEQLLEGAAVLSQLKDGDRVLMAEGCTHHRQCNDIGSVKLPRLIRAFSGSEPEFIFSSGNGFPEDLSGIRLIVHCGGCMLNTQQMAARLQEAKRQGIPVVNYGLAIARMNGILERSIAPLGR